MKDRARIEDKMNKADIELESAKEDAKGYVCNKIVDMVRSDNCDSEGSIDEGDLECLKDDCNSLLRACEQVDKCKDIKALKMFLKNRYGRGAIKEAIGV